MKVKLFKAGRDAEYSMFCIPPELADKYSLNQPCTIEIVEMEEHGGFLIKKAT
jgi:hypothetical protein